MRRPPTTSGVQAQSIGEGRCLRPPTMDDDHLAATSSQRNQLSNQQFQVMRVGDYFAAHLDDNQTHGQSGGAARPSVSSQPSMIFMD
jgi:hypothetical protein